MGDEPTDLYTELQRIRFDPSAVPEATFTLTVVGGRAGARPFALDGSQSCRVLVGQSESCDLRLEDPAVSRRHLALDIQGSNVRLRDLGSTNGTRVNGVRVVEALLVGGEVIELGGTRLRLELGDAPVNYELADQLSFGSMVGASTEMRRLYPLCDRLAASDVPVVIEGETGTGKEVLAESLHQ